MRDLYDKDMREALFSFFEDSLGNIRFLEEFVMGKSRADAVMVADRELIGFELKSDRDSLARLKKQVKDYDKYYDRNYIVIGAHYQKKIEEHIPEYWGIMLVTEENDFIEVEELRKARNKSEHSESTKVLQHQMEFLWREELIHIVKANSLGGVTAYNKKELRKKIIDKLTFEEVKVAMLAELMEREYATIYTCTYYTLEGPLSFITDGIEIKQIIFGEAPSKYIQSNDINLHQRILRQMEEYFAGNRKKFELPLENKRFNSFTKKVYTVLSTIPYGETSTYAKIAEDAGRPTAYRAVGMVNKRNPFPVVIPCHRVIAANGAVSGYAGGVKFKTMLLDLEKYHKDDLNI